MFSHRKTHFEKDTLRPTECHCEKPEWHPVTSNFEDIENADQISFGKVLIVEVSLETKAEDMCTSQCLLMLMQLKKN